MTKRRRIFLSVTVMLVALILIVSSLIFLNQTKELEPGGIWLQKPIFGTVIAENSITLHFSAYSNTIFPLDRVELTYETKGFWHKDKDCVFQPNDTKNYTCILDFKKLGIFPGLRIRISFDVYGLFMKFDLLGRFLVNFNQAPNGEDCFYWQYTDPIDHC